MNSSIVFCVCMIVTLHCSDHYQLKHDRKTAANFALSKKASIDEATYSMYLAQLCNIPRLHSISAWQSAIALVVCTQLETQLFILWSRNINHYNLWRLHVTTECFVDYRIHSKHFVTLCAANVLWLVAIGTRMKKRNEGRLGGRIKWLNLHSFIN